MTLELWTAPVVEVDQWSNAAKERYAKASRQKPEASAIDVMRDVCWINSVRQNHDMIQVFGRLL